MLGALIGDLAAWTYEHKRECFAKHAIHKNARFSETGFGILATCRIASDALRCPIGNSEYDYNKLLEKYLDTLHTTLGNYEIYDTQKFEKNYEYRMTPLLDDLILGSILNEGSRIRNLKIDEDCQGISVQQNEWMTILGADKPDLYNSQISLIIARLLNGLSKEDALKGTMFIKVQEGENNPLGYVSLAWDYFEKSSDFWSAIENAVTRSQFPYTRRVTAIVGALADAMYGCPQITIPEYVDMYFHNELTLLSNANASVSHSIEIDKIINADMPDKNWQSMFMFLLDRCPYVYDYIDKHNIEIFYIRKNWKQFFADVATDILEIREFIRDYFDDFFYMDEAELAENLTREAMQGLKDLDGVPIYNHAKWVASLGDSKEEKIVGYLHDIVKDTSYTLEDIKKMRFRKETLDAIELLTHDNTMPYGQYIHNIVAYGTAITLKVKINDLSHNLYRERNNNHMGQVIKHEFACLQILRMLTGDYGDLYEESLNKLINRLNDAITGRNIYIKRPVEFLLIHSLSDDPQGTLSYIKSNQTARCFFKVYPINDKDLMPISAPQQLINSIHDNIADNQGIIEVGNGITQSGKHYIYSIIKELLKPNGAKYILKMHLCDCRKGYCIEGEFEEIGVTGMRDTTIYSKLINEIGANDWTMDPYDSNFTKGKKMNLSEQRKYDDLFPKHPLSEQRKFIDYIIDNN